MIRSQALLILIDRVKALGAAIRKRWRHPSDDDRMLIGKLLKNRLIITDEQLDQALRVQKNRREQLIHPIHLGLIMVELGYATEKQVIQVINEHYRLSITSLSDNIEALIQRRYGGPFNRLLSHPLPIWMKLAVMTTILIVMTIFPLGLITIRQQQEELYRQTLRIGKVSINYFANQASMFLLESKSTDELQMNTLITEAVKVEGIRYAVIVDVNGTIRAHTDYRKIGSFYVPPPSPLRMTEEADIRHFDYQTDAGERLLNLEKSIRWSGRRLGQVHVGISLDFIEELTRAKSRSIGLLSLLIIGAGVLVAVVFGIHFSRPIARLVKATDEISKGNYHFKVPHIRNDEVGNLASAFNRMSRELWMKSLMQKSFGKYVGREVLEMIMIDPESEWLKGRVNDATVLFTDIRGFTAYSKGKDPEALVDKLNGYFEIATAAIMEYGGYIDKFIGDAVMGVFGVPSSCDNHRERAVRAAVAMQERFKTKAETEPDCLLFAVGIGINTGMVVSGNIGSQVKMEYTVIGDTVNVASRLNGLAGAGEIIISKNLKEHLKDLVVTDALPPRPVKGIGEAVEVFKVVGIKEGMAG